MKISFQDTIYDILTEAELSKKLFADLLNAWSPEKPDISREEIQNIYNWFVNKQQSFVETNPLIYSFLYRFNGTHGTRKFDPINLKQIAKYTYKEIKYLMAEYDDNAVAPVPDNLAALNDKSVKSTPAKIEASKSLWESESNAIVNDGSFRVYNILGQQMSMNFGYYLDKVLTSSSKSSNSRWCVTWRGGEEGSNRWAYYSGEARSIYFVIDESKDPYSDQYYMGALQRVNNSVTGYILTSMYNNGDNPMSWKQILDIYPKLADHKDSIAVKPFNQDELKEKTLVGQITETPGSQFEFRRMERSAKLAFINNHAELKSPLSWRSMDEKLRAHYIVITEAQEVKNKFSNFEFVSEIKKVGSEFKLLDNRLKQLGLTSGVSTLYDQLMSTEFALSRRSEDNEKISLYISKVTKKFGLHNSRTGSWIELDGITYDPSYTRLEKEDLVRISNNETYMVEIFSRSTEPDETSFYCLTKSGAVNGRFVSARKWKELREKLPTRSELKLKKSDTDPLTIPVKPDQQTNQPKVQQPQLAPLDPEDMDIKEIGRI